MAFPDGLTLITVSGHFDAAEAGNAHGTIEFIARYPLVGPTDDTIVAPFTIAADLVDGDFAVQLPATNDPAWSPQDWAYAVRATVAGSAVRGSLQLDYQTAAVELADLIQVDGTATPGVSYVLLARLGVAGGVATLGEDGLVPADQLPEGNGGTGGAVAWADITGKPSFATVATSGSYTDLTDKPTIPTVPVQSVNTKTGTVVLTASDVGADASGSAATALASAQTYADGAVSTHSADTTSVHGIADTSALVGTTDTRLSDARTPTAHASSHGSAGADAVSLNASQITAGALVTGRGGTGLTGFTSGGFVTASSTTALATSKVVPAGVVVGTTDTQTLTNKTLTAPAISSPTGLAKGDVGLGSVTNDAQVKLSTVTTKGDLLAGTASATVARLGAGSDGQVLAADSAQTAGLKWITSAPVLVLGPSDPVPGGTATGTVIVRTAT